MQRPLRPLRPPYTLVQGQWVYAGGLPIALIDRVSGRVYPLQRGVTVERIQDILGNAPKLPR